MDGLTTTTSLTFSRLLLTGPSFLVRTILLDVSTTQKLHHMEYSGLEMNNARMCDKFMMVLEFFPSLSAQFAAHVGRAAALVTLFDGAVIVTIGNEDDCSLAVTVAESWRCVV